MNRHNLSRIYLPAVIFLLSAQILVSGAVWANQKAQQSGSIDIVERTRELMPVAEELRGLSFITDLPVDLVTQEEMSRIIARELREQISEEDDRAFSAMYTMLGLMPQGSSMLGDYRTMAEEQVAGLYDPEAKRFYVVDIDLGSVLAAMFGGLGALGSFMEGFLTSFDFDMTDTIIVHELTHALDDQHFDIRGKMDELLESDSDDSQLAYQSLLEGNATRTMNEYTYGRLGMDETMIDTYSELSVSLAEGMLEYSPFLERIMIVPYFQGEAFVNYILDTGGQEALDSAFLDPPVSMEQILHPERYSPSRDVPSSATKPDLSEVLPDWHLEATDTLGELIIGVMFETKTGNKELGARVADGWDYDVVTTWRAPSGDLALAWVTVWDSDADAGQFFDAYLDYLDIMFPQGSWQSRESDYALYTGMGLAAAVERGDRLVVIVEGVPERLVDECLDAARPERVTYR
jgi:hypothetical protein